MKKFEKKICLNPDITWQQFYWASAW